MGRQAKPFVGEKCRTPVELLGPSEFTGSHGMPPKSQRVNELSPIEVAVERLKRIDWNLTSLDVTEGLEGEWARYLHGLEMEKYGGSLSQFEETEERSRWLRSQAMRLHGLRFKDLCGLCCDFVRELTRVSGQSRLGTRAGLQIATAHERPSSWIGFKPLNPPEPPPLNLNEYETNVGGPHVFGARVLWWCAAAKSPEEFGFAGMFDWKIWKQPFWFIEVAGGSLQVNRRPLTLLQEAAIYCLENRGNAEVGEEPPNDGPGPAGRFYWKGRQIAFQARQRDLIKFLWSTPGKMREFEDAAEDVWGGTATNNAISTCVSRTNKRFLHEKIPITIRVEDSHLVLEFH